MAISVTHTFVSAKVDDVDATLVRSSNWNAAHTLTMATAKLLGRATAAAGAVEEIALGTNLSFSGTTLNAAQAVSAASKLLGRGSASGAGSAEEITLGSGLTMTGTTLAATAAAATTTAPQGRLTLQTATPVMTTTQSAKTTIYYTPYIGAMLPIYDGSSMVMTAFAELNVATSDTTKSPAAIGASKVNDWFVWNDAGTVRIGHGPDWTSDTARSAGTALVRVNGIWLNNVSITNGPAASRGTYVGTTRSNASSQLDWIYGGLGAGGVAGFFGVWNCYNRRTVTSTVSDSTDSWTASGVWRAANNSTNARTSFVMGLEEDVFIADYIVTATNSGSDAAAGIGFDSVTVRSGISTYSNAGGSALVLAKFSTTALGFHYTQALEYVLTGTTTFFGDSGLPLILQTGLMTNLQM